MSARLSAGLLAVAALMWGVVDAQQSTTPQGGKAVSVLKTVLANQRAVDSVRIETRPGGGGTWQLKVQTAARLGIKVTLLYPVSRAGIVSVDDGKELMMFLPDEERLVVQPSPYLIQPSVAWRMGLIERNYRVNYGRTAEIAGLRTTELVMRPVSPPMPVRRMFVEPKHSTGLKYLVEVGEEEHVIFETKSVSFGPESRRDFGLPDEASGAEVERLKGPVKLAKPEDAKKTAGFVARLPGKLPHGFRVWGTYLMGLDRVPYVSVKLSDGMASLSVAQWLPSRFGRKSPVEDSAIRLDDEHGVRYSVTAVPGDYVPKGVMLEVLESFVGHIG